VWCCQCRKNNARFDSFEYFNCTNWQVATPHDMVTPMTDPLNRWFIRLCKSKSKQNLAVNVWAMGAWDQEVVLCFFQ
jgi:hypothetical protein